MTSPPQLSDPQRRTFLETLYHFHERTICYKPSIRTLTHNIPIGRYIADGMDAKGYVKSIMWGNLCMAGVIDLDAHNGEDVHNQHSVLCIALEAVGLKHISAISSFNPDGTARGIHIYLLFNKPQNPAALRSALEFLTQSVVAGDNIDFFPTRKAIRPFWVNKGDGTKPGQLLHPVDQVENYLNDGFLELLNFQALNSQEEEVVSYRGSIHDTGLWELWLEQMAPGLSMDELHEAVKEKALAEGMTYYTFTQVMIAGYYGISVQTAKTRLRRYRERTGLTPAISSNREGRGHLYSTGLSLVAPQQATTIEFELKPGCRHQLTGILVRRALNSSYSPAEVIELSQRVFKRSYKGQTSLEEHTKATGRWIASYQRTNAA